MKGSFEWIKCLRQGGSKAISFTLTCDNMLHGETFDASIMDGSGQLLPMVFRQLHLNARRSFRFDYDTVGWNWCQGDVFAILDKKGKVDKQWTLNLKVPAPGECRECHGTHRCRACGGSGSITDNHTHTVSFCEVCGGTGICQTCYVPMRNPQFYNNNFPQSGGSSAIQASNANMQRKVATLRQQIADLQARIEKCECDLRMMQLKGHDVSMHYVYITNLRMKGQLELNLMNKQFELRQLTRSDWLE